MSKKAKISIVVFILIAIVAFLFIKNHNKKSMEYTLAKVNNYNYFIIKQSNKYGVIETKGNVVIEPVYDEVIIPNPERDIFVCYKDNTPICLNSKNEPIFTEYDQVEPIRLKNTVSDLMYEKSTMTYIKDDKMGLINLDGKKITDSKYESIETLPSQEGKLLVKQQGKVGIININGYEIVKPNYDQIQIDGYYDDEEDDQKSGYITSNTTKEGYRFGYINYKGEEILKPEFNELSRITEIQNPEEVYLILAKDGQYGLYKNHEVIIDNDYQSIGYEDGNQVFIVEKSGRFGIMDLKGSTIIPLEYDQIDITGIGIYANKNGQTTVFDKKGQTLNINEETSILNTENENYKIEINSADGKISYGVVNNKGEQVIPKEYNYIEYLEDDFFIASDSEGRLGVIDSNNNKILPLVYSSIHKIEETDILQASKDEEGIDEYYTSKIQKICEVPISTVTLKDTYIEIESKAGTKYIDINTQKEIANTEIFKGNSLFASNNNGYWGFVDINGNVKVDYKYEKVTELNKYGYAGIKENGKWGVIDSQGNIVLEPKYNLTEDLERMINFIGQYYSVEYGFGEIYYTNDIM